MPPWKVWFAPLLALTNKSRMIDHNPVFQFLRTRHWLAGLAGLLPIILVGCSSTPPPSPAPLSKVVSVQAAETAARLSQAGNWVAAAREWQKAADWFTALNDPVLEAMALHNLAQAQKELGRLDPARRNLETAASLNRDHGQTNTWWRNQLVLLQVDELAGDTNALAVRFASLAPEIETRAPAQVPGLYLLEWGRWQMRSGNWAAAEQAFGQAALEFSKAADRPGSAAVLVNRATLAMRQANYPQSLKDWQAALHEYEKMADPAGVAAALTGLGDSLLAENPKSPEGIQFLQRAARSFRVQQRPAGEIVILQRLITALRNVGQPIAETQASLAAAHANRAAWLETAEQPKAAAVQWRAAADLWNSLADPEKAQRASATAERLEQQPTKP